MRVERRSVIDADRDTVWKFVSDPDCYPQFIASLERWEIVTEGPMAVGSRYTVHWKIGSVPIGGVVEVVRVRPDPRPVLDRHHRACRYAAGSGCGTAGTARRR